ncbi:TlpA family protein disulfide reductase [Saccharothrix hoggarensis]|uniref:TlpA family protein disulfide reductase n=1 Tax=Saccharothrix hoggarensis TaxID=913853 RepID=A0ABW3R3H4_9PSEU
MRAGARWAVVVLVLVVAGAVAVWPRDPDPPAVPQSQRSAPDVVAAREQAALQPCPQGAPGPAALRGVTASCLGDGRPVDVSSALSGRAVLNFWATWCVPCQEELPVLDAYSREPGAVPVVTVLVESKEADGLELLAKLGVRLPSVYDPADAVRKAVGVPTLPMNYLVNADGALTPVTNPSSFTSVDQVRGVVG